jgi:hypothetical protein
MVTKSGVMWRSVFFHEFLGLSLRNFQGVDGSLSTQGVDPPLRAYPGLATVLLVPLAFLRFDLSAPWNDVIGFSARVRLRTPIDFPTRVEIVRLGDAAALSLGSLHSEDRGVLVGRAFMRVDGADVELGSVRLPRRTFTDLRIDWHTSGVASLAMDGQLVWYHNAIAPGAQITLTNVVVSGPEPIPSPPPLPFIPNLPPFYNVARVFVRALRRPDSLLSTIGLVGSLDVPLDGVLERCVALRMTELLRLCDRLRAFASLVVAKLTTPGDATSDTLQTAFSASATSARQLALDAFQQFAAMVESGDYSAADSFLATYTALLEILYEALPSEFEALVHDHLARSVEDKECRALGEAIVDRNEVVLRPLIALLNVMGDRLKAVVGRA